jgi:hypothetical protein
MSLSELRKRQQREVLDVWNDVSRQVQERQFQQVKQFDEAVKPKKTRDLEAEASAYRIIESLNKLVEIKVVSLENLIDFISRTTKSDPFAQSEYRKLFTTIILNQDLISQWNSFVRVYKAPAVSTQSVELMKVKIEELKPNMESINFGLQELLNFLYENGDFTSKELFSLLQTYAVYREIKRQIDVSDYQILALDSIERSFKNIVAEQDVDFRVALNDIWNKSLAKGNPLSEVLVRGYPKIEDAELLDRKRQLDADVSARVPIGALEEKEEDEPDVESEKSSEAVKSVPKSVPVKVERPKQNKIDEWGVRLENYLSSGRQIDDVSKMSDYRLAQILGTTYNTAKKYRAFITQLYRDKERELGEEEEEEEEEEEPVRKKGGRVKESFLAQLSNKPLRGSGEDRTTLQKLDYDPDMLMQFLPHYRRRLPFGFNDDRNDFFQS